MLNNPNENIVAQSPNGSGKTVTYLCGALDKINLKQNKTQVIVLAHTRELATQITDVCKEVAQKMEGCEIFKLTKILESEIESHVIISTPGVLLQCIKLSKISLENVKTFVFDEADELFKDKDTKTKESKNDDKKDPKNRGSKNFKQKGRGGEIDHCVELAK